MDKYLHINQVFEVDRKKLSQSSAYVHHIRWLESSEWSAWDAFAQGHPMTTIFTNSSWKNVLESSFPHIKSRFIVMVNPSTNQIKAGLPFYCVSSPLLGDRFVSIPFASFSDPLVSSADELSAMLQWIVAKNTYSHHPSIELRSWRSLQWAQAAKLAQTNLYKHHYVDLSQTSPDEHPLLSNHSFRRSVEKARKSGLSVKRTTNPDFLAQFHLLLSNDRKRFGLPAIPLRFFEALFFEWADKGFIMIMASQKSELVAGMILLIHNGICDCEYVANSPVARGNGVQQLLLLEAMNLAIIQRCRIFSMGRTAPSNEGLMNYKNRIATHVDDLPTYSLDNNNLNISRDRESTLAYKILRITCRHAPSSLYQLISTFCYNHLG